MNEELKSFVINVSEGTEIFKEGDDGNEMYFIQSGKIRIEKNIDGKPERLALLEKGDFFGEMAIIDSIPRSASAIADEDTSLLKIDGGNFGKVLSTNVEIVIRIIRKYSARLRDANAKLEALLLDRKEMDKGIQDILQSVKRPSSEDTGNPLAELKIEGSDKTFPIFREAVTVGREDPVTGIIPDVDLTEHDETRSVSRKHARIIKERTGFVLIEEIGVANGTFVNDERLEPGKSKSIQAEDHLQFGNIKLIFLMNA